LLIFLILGKYFIQLNIVDALIIVDMQKVFVSGAEAVPASEQLLLQLVL